MITDEMVNFSLYIPKKETVDMVEMVLITVIALEINYC